jgi:hypothetical protein
LEVLEGEIEGWLQGRKLRLFNCLVSLSRLLPRSTTLLALLRYLKLLSDADQYDEWLDFESWVFSKNI